MNISSNKGLLMILGGTVLSILISLGVMFYHNQEAVNHINATATPIVVPPKAEREIINQIHLLEAKRRFTTIEVSEAEKKLASYLVDMEAGSSDSEYSYLLRYEYVTPEAISKIALNKDCQVDWIDSFEPLKSVKGPNGKMFEVVTVHYIGPGRTLVVEYTKTYDGTSLGSKTDEYLFSQTCQIK
jgi:hypothetical protein